MAKRKKTRTQKKESRIARARNWLPTYKGTHIVRAYRKKFHVNTICAVHELQEAGYEFKPGYVDNLLKAEAARVERLKAEKEAKRLTERRNDYQDDRFFSSPGTLPAALLMASLGKKWGWSLTKTNLTKNSPYRIGL